MEVKVNEIQDYCFCPRYYSLKKQDPNTHIKQAYDEALHRCFYEYLYALQSDVGYATIDTLKKRWGHEWVKQKRNSEIMCTPSPSKRDNYDNKRKHGIDGIYNFHSMMDTKQCPILINKPYEIHIGKLTVSGTWEYVREITRDDEKVFQIIKFKTETNRFDISNAITHDISLTAALKAFTDTFNVDSAEVVCADIYSKKMHVMRRTQDDVKMFIQTAKSVALSIKNNLACISPDKKCYHCEYRDACASNFKGEII